MNAILRTALAAAGLAIVTQASAQVTFYEHDGYEGRSFTAESEINDFARSGFNDRASSVVVLRDRWEACEDARFGGRCVILRPGRYPSLSALGLNDRISSARAINSNARYDDSRYAPAPAPVYDNHRRRDERLYEANVTSVRAILGPPEQRCWTEREQVQVAPQRSGVNVPGAVVGALLGGVLGHQVGSGRGNDVATAGGAVAGGVIGANVGRSGGSQQVTTQDVQRCETVSNSARPDHWDVTYDFRGVEHRMQTTSPPGSTVTVNRDGEPRA
jgi:uncharacterized protein YcfJ